MKHSLHYYSLTTLFATLSCALSISGQVPAAINYQGRILVGNAPFNGTGEFKFALVNPEGDTAYWNHDGTYDDNSPQVEPSTAIELAVDRGRYRVALGDTSTANMSAPILPAVFLNEQVFLRVWFNDGAHGFERLAPDQRLLSVGYAMVAEKALSVAAGGGDDLGDHAAIENLSLNGNWLSNDGDNEGVSVDDNGNVGIGVASPAAKLHIDGGLLLAATAASLPAAGTIRWTGVDFEGFNGVEWVSLTEVTVSAPQPPPGMALIPAGDFQMGDSDDEGDADEAPVHTVATSAFYIDKFEVSNANMRRVLQWALDHSLITVSNGAVSNSEGNAQELLDVDDGQSEIEFSNGTFSVITGRENFPCIEVTWFGAQAYCNYRSDIDGLDRAVDFADWTQDADRNGYRLPTEAEWEKAARGGLSGYRYPWNSRGGVYSDHIDGSRANYRNSSDPFESNLVGTSPVGYYSGSQSPVGVDVANGYGLYDTSGNVWEWCQDWYRDDWYNQAVAVAADTEGPPNGTVRVVRGGAWGELGNALRTAVREGVFPSDSFSDLGFRTVRRP